MNIIDSIEKLENAGFTHQQATTTVEMMSSTLELLVKEKVATKDDMEALGIQLRHEFKQITYQLTVRMGSFVASGVIFLSILLRLT